MSGIVRGWADDMDDVREILYTKQMHDVDIPVAVVPLDDATLAGMANRVARILSLEHADVCNVNAEDVWTIYGHEFSEQAMRYLRAALGLEGGA